MGSLDQKYPFYGENPENGSLRSNIPQFRTKSQKQGIQEENTPFNKKIARKWDAQVKKQESDVLVENTPICVKNTKMGY